MAHSELQTVEHQYFTNVEQWPLEDVSIHSNLIQSWRIHNGQPEAGWIEAWSGSEEAVRKVVKVEKVVKEVKVVVFCWIY